MGVVLEFRRPVKKVKPVLESQVIVHLMTQRDQPYGSERRCCENCGVMLVGTARPYMCDEKPYNNLPAQYRRCIDKVNT